MGGVTKSRTSFFLVTGLLVFVSAIVLTIVVVVGNNKDKKNEQQLRGNDEVPTKLPIPAEDGLNDINQPVRRSTYIQTTMTFVFCVCIICAHAIRFWLCYCCCLAYLYRKFTHNAS